MILLINDPFGGKESYQIKLESILKDIKTGQPLSTIMLTNSNGESMSLYEAGIFRMIDDYFKKYF